MLRYLGWCLAISTGLQAGDNFEPTDHLAPPGFRGNPWGPVATAARKAGEIPPIDRTP
jgi:hypothetical protein